MVTDWYGAVIEGLLDKFCIQNLKYFHVFKNAQPKSMSTEIRFANESQKFL